VRSADNHQELTACTVSSGQVLRLWRIYPEVKLLLTIDEGTGLGNAGFLPREARLVTGSLRVWNAVTGAELERLAKPADLATSLVISPDGQRVARATRKSVVLWDVKTRQELRLIDEDKDDLYGLAFSPDSQTLATCSFYKGMVSYWNAATGKSRPSFIEKEFGTRAVAFSPDGKQVIHGGEASVIHCRNRETGQEIRRIAVQDNLHSLAFSPDGKHIAASTALFYRSFTHIWEAATGKELHVYPRHEQRIDFVTYMPDGKRIVTSGVDGTVRMWDAATGKQQFQIGETKLSDERSVSNSVALSPDGLALAIAEGANVRLHSAATGAASGQFKTEAGEAIAVAYSPRGNLLAVLCEGTELIERGSDTPITWRVLQVRDATKGKVSRTLPRIDPRTTNITYSPDGKWLATQTQEVIVLWDAITGKQGAQFRGRRSCFSPGSNLLAVHGEDWRLRLMDIATGKPFCELGRSALNALTFSPDGKSLAVGGSSLADGNRDEPLSAWIYDVTSGKIIWKAQELSQTYGVQSLAFSPDGRHLATAGNDNTVLVREAPQEQ
jgi:WD40 repeat protein